MAKKPTLQNINKEAKKLDVKRKVEIGGFEFIINEYFQPLRIQKLLTDYLIIIDSLKKENQVLNSPDTIVYLTHVVEGLTLKYFSNIPFREEENHETLVATVHNLINLRLFEELWNAFNPKEVDEINKAIKKLGENLPQAQDMISELLLTARINEMQDDSEYDEVDDVNGI